MGRDPVPSTSPCRDKGRAAVHVGPSEHTHVLLLKCNAKTQVVLRALSLPHPGTLVSVRFHGPVRTGRGLAASPAAVLQGGGA